MWEKIRLVNTNWSSWSLRLLYFSLRGIKSWPWNKQPIPLHTFMCDHISSPGTGQSLKQDNYSGLIPEVLPMHSLHGQPLFPPTAQKASRADQQCKWLWNALTDRAFTWGYGGLISCVPECDKWQSKCCDFPSSSVEASQWKKTQQNPERSKIWSKKHNRTPGRHQLLRQARQQWQIYRWNLWRLFAWQYVGWTDSEWNIASRSEYFNKGKLKICGDWAFKLS